VEAGGDDPPGKAGRHPPQLTGDDFRLKLDDLREAGYALTERPPLVLHPADGEKRYSPDFEERLGLAYRYALAGTKDAPHPGWADFSRFSSALHMLCPEDKAGKKLRNVLDRHPQRRVERHVRTHERTRWMRDARDEDGNKRVVESDLDSWTTREYCREGDEGAERETYVERDQERLFLRPRADREQPRRVDYLTPIGERRPAFLPGNLAGAFSCVQGLPAFLLEDGAGFEITRLPDGAVDEVLTYSRDTQAWTCRDGKPFRGVAFDGDEWRFVEDLTPEQREHLERRGNLMMF
jgi:hypothetical protein